MKVVVNVEFPGEVDRERAADLLRRVAENIKEGQFIRAAWQEGDARLAYSIVVNPRDGQPPLSE